MEKTRYYVTVDIGPRAGEIRETLEVNDPNYDFEIEATREEIERLEKLFNEVGDTDFSTFVLAHIPFLNNERKENVTEDQKIQEIYRMIYQLGTPATKERMKEAGLVH
ncbi:hypothetical protein [Laceyella putida]|uniref:Hydrolase n=1 Tax=Laceyella putida TaxID=110101 RepID=A0ABW2RLL2_9BACL